MLPWEYEKFPAPTPGDHRVRNCNGFATWRQSQWGVTVHRSVSQGRWMGGREMKRNEQEKNRKWIFWWKEINKARVDFFPRSRKTRYISASHATKYIPNLGFDIHTTLFWTYKTYHELSSLSLNFSYSLVLCGHSLWTRCMSVACQMHVKL